jgi:hypothetical protein
LAVRLGDFKKFIHKETYYQIKKRQLNTKSRPRSGLLKPDKNQRKKGAIFLQNVHEQHGR